MAEASLYSVTFGDDFQPRQPIALPGSTNPYCLPDRVLLRIDELNNVRLPETAEGIIKVLEDAFEGTTLIRDYLNIDNLQIEPIQRIELSTYPMELWQVVNALNLRDQMKEDFFWLDPTIRLPFDVANEYRATIRSAFVKTILTLAQPGDTGAMLAARYMGIDLETALLLPVVIRPRTIDPVPFTNSFFHFRNVTLKMDVPPFEAAPVLGTLGRVDPRLPEALAALQQWQGLRIGNVLTDNGIPNITPKIAPPPPIRIEEALTDIEAPFSIVPVLLRGEGGYNQVRKSIRDFYQFGGVYEGVFGVGKYLIRSQSPDWLMRGASGANIPCGGPGSLPHRVATTDSRVAKVRKLHQLGGEKPQENLSNGKVPRVRIYVLDTLYSSAVQDHLKISSTDQGQLKLPWLHHCTMVPLRTVPDGQAILSGHDRGTIHVTEAERTVFDGVAPETIEGIDPLNIKKLQSVFSNHGPFVVDVLFRQIPTVYRDRVDIRLVEALNPLASGHLSLFLKVLQWVRQDIELSFNNDNIDFVILNFSCMTTVRNLFDDLMEQKSSFEKEEAKEHFKAVIAMYRSLFYLMLRSRYGAKATDVNAEQIESQVKIIAAAGNDARNGVAGPLRQAPAIPAVLPEVWGVGALEKVGDSTLSEYSNKADDKTIKTEVRFPEWGVMQFTGEQGIAAIGGGLHPNWNTSPKRQYVVDQSKLTDDDIKKAKAKILLPDSQNGVIGPFFGPTVDDQYTLEMNSNRTPMKGYAFGWAEWSGTSFAAPKVVGRLAAHLLAGQTMAQAEANMVAPDTTNSDFMILSGDDSLALANEAGEYVIPPSS